jgi:hypothetical protein
MFLRRLRVFDNLSVWLQQRQANLVRPALVQELVDNVAYDIAVAIDATSNGMPTSGIMRSRFSKIGISAISGGYTAYIGRTNSPSSAPSGTIAAFLEEYPQYRRKFGKKGKKAWWGLPFEARKRLAEERKQGLWGGIAGEAPYYSLQEEGKAEVDIRGRHFIETGIQNLETHLRKIMSRELGRG